MLFNALPPFHVPSLTKTNVAWILTCKKQHRLPTCHCNPNHDTLYAIMHLHHYSQKCTLFPSPTHLMGQPAINVRTCGSLSQHTKMKMVGHQPVDHVHETNLENSMEWCPEWKLPVLSSVETSTAVKGFFTKWASMLHLGKFRKKGKDSVGLFIYAGCVLLLVST
jgi:hypothetical protein